MKAWNIKTGSNLDGQSTAITKNTSKFNHHLHPTYGIFNFDINQMFPMKEMMCKY